MVSTGSTYTDYTLIANNLSRSLAQEAAKQPNANDTAYYLQHIGNVKSIDDFLGNTRLFNYAMTAFGLGDMAYAKGLMRQVLTGGIDSSTSFANRMNDDRFIQFAKTFNFNDNGAATTSSTAAQQGVVDSYNRQQLETDAGNDNQGVRLALYFQRMAPTITSAYNILGDAALYQVIQTTLGLPAAMSNENIDTQAATISKQIDISSLQDPAKLQTFLQRFTAMWDATESTGATVDPVVSLFDSSSQPTIDDNLLVTLQNLKFGGA